MTPGSENALNDLSVDTQARKKIRVSRVPVMGPQNTPSKSQSLDFSGHWKEVKMEASGGAVSIGQILFIPGEDKGTSNHQNPPMKSGRSTAEPGRLINSQRAENLDSLRDKKGMIQGREEHVYPEKKLRDDDVKVRTNLLEKWHQRRSYIKGKVKPEGHSCVIIAERTPSHSPEEGRG